MAFVCSPAAIQLQFRQVLRWLKAAEQDRDPGVKFLHASYGVGNMDILRQILSDGEIEAAAGQNPLPVLQRLIQLQDEGFEEFQTRG